jgi:hypothetical protein
MSAFRRYDSNFIQSLRPNKNTIISKKLSEHFDWINELFLASSQYQENRKKINYNQINSQKWRNNNINIVNSIMLMLNGLDKTVYNDVEKKITSIEIKDINNMRKIIEILHEKTCESWKSPIILDLYINILSKIINNGIWYYKVGDKVTDYICPRVISVSIAQKNYMEMLDTFLSIIENFKKTNDEITYYKVKNQKFIGNMLYIGKLYNNKIISIEIINNICKDIIDKVNLDITNIDLIEYLLELLDTLEDYPNMDEVIVNLNLIVNKISNRVKYLIINFIDSQKNKKISDSQNIEIKENVLDTKESYNNLIMEYLINFNESKIELLIDDFSSKSKTNIEGELIISILRKYSVQSEHKLIILLNNLIEKNIVTKEIINTKIELYNSNGVIEDIAEEYPIIHKFIQKIISLGE